MLKHVLRMLKHSYIRMLKRFKNVKILIYKNVKTCLRMLKRFKNVKTHLNIRMFSVTGRFRFGVEIIRAR